jgi:hypothetical protein
LTCALLLGSSTLLWAPDWIPGGPGGGGGGGGGGGESTPPQEKPCGEKLQVSNRTSNDCAVVIAWDRYYQKYEVKAKKAVEIEPIYCPSTLLVVTEGRRSVALVDPKKSYELVWAPGEAMYVIREVS